MGELAPSDWNPSKNDGRVAMPEPATAAEAKRIEKLNVLKTIKKPVLSAFPFLTKVVYKNLTVKQYAELLMKTVGVPQEYQAGFLPYLLPFLDPAVNPDYAVLLVEAGQPCKKLRVTQDFEDMAANIERAREGGLDEEELQQVINGRYIANVLMVAYPLGYSGIAQNLEYDVNGNAIGAKQLEVNRLYKCDRSLELKYPEAHAEARKRWIEATADGLVKRIPTAGAQLIAGLLTTQKELNAAFDEAVAQNGKGWNALPGLISRLVNAQAYVIVTKKLGVPTANVEATIAYASTILPLLQKAADDMTPVTLPPRPQITPEQTEALKAQGKISLTRKAGRRHTKTNRKTRRNKKEHRNVVPSHRKRRGTSRR